MGKRKDFQKSLFKWYAKNARSLPWRRTRDPYKIWVSEIMLQQTTVNAVIPYYQRWIKTFPNIGKVAHAPLARILKIWQGLGYYQRAKNIHRAAKIICAKYNEALPKKSEELRNLPGFGPYTVSAVLSIAFDQRHPLIDANVRRVVMRLMALQGEADTKKDKDILVFLDNVLPVQRNNIFNQALMELGALVCRPLEPLCLLCPVKTFCLAYKNGIQNVIPAPRKRVIEKIEAVCGIIKSKGSYFIQKRPSAGLLADLWEFPGGKIKKGESSKRALGRELKEELGVSLVVAKPLGSITHAYTKFKVHLHVWQCKVKPEPLVDKNHKWARFLKLENYPMPSATAQIIKTMLKA